LKTVFDWPHGGPPAGSVSCSALEVPNAGLQRHYFGSIQSPNSGSCATLECPVGDDLETVRRGKKKEEQPLESPFVRAMEVRKMLGSRSLVERCERAGWFEPVKRGQRMTLYLRKDIEAAAFRIQCGELS
jgi:hypothetical protein